MKSNVQSPLSSLLQFDDSKRVVANLMARENISVQVVDGAPTASFQPSTRVLTIPNWSTMDVAQIDLLMAHEIGHALFTDASLFESIAQEKPGLFGYVNVVEDARIERKMKTAFPGLARVFYNGYHKFHTDGPILKGTKSALYHPQTGVPTPIAGMRLIDRINLYYKIGAFVDVPFTAAERVWIHRIDKASSLAEVVQIAKELHTYAKETEAQKKQDQSGQSGQKGQKGQKSQSTSSAPSDMSDESSDSDEADGDDGESSDKSKSKSGQNKKQSPSKKSDEAESGDEDDKDDDQNGADSDGDNTDKTDGDGDEGDDSDDADGDDEADGDSDGDDADGDKSDSDSGDDADDANGDGDDAVSDDDVASETVAGIEEALKKLASTGNGIQVRHLLMSPLTDSTIKDRVVSAPVWAESAMTAMKKHDPSIATFLKAREDVWVGKYGATAQSMALEFERRKTAKALQNIKTSKTGKLNLAKLSQFKFTEDLFLRSQTMPVGKSHGVVMVIDASGSMGDCFANVIDQVLLFALFASKVNIPFEAYMFTDAAARAASWSRRDEVAPHRPGRHMVALSDTGRLVGLVNTHAGRQSLKVQIAALHGLQAVHTRRYGYSQYAANMNNEQAQAIRSIPYANLGGTPLFTGMMLGEAMVARLKKAFRLDKMTFVVITDGQDTNHLQYTSEDIDQYNGRVISVQHTVGDTAIVVRDTVTKKNFVQAEESRGWDGKSTMVTPTMGVMTLLFDIIKARHDCRCVYLYLKSGSLMSNRGRGRRSSGDIVPYEVQYLSRAGVDYTTTITVDVMRKAIGDTDQFVLPAHTAICDLAMLLSYKELEFVDDKFKTMNADGMSQRKIAQEFTKAMTKAVSNRVFVNTVIPFLA